MRGFPKWINTKKDMDKMLVMYPEKAEKRLNEMLNGRFVWNTTGPAIGEGIADITHRVVDEGIADVKVKMQQELREDPHCRLFQIGFTVAAVEITKVLVKT